MGTVAMDFVSLSQSCSPSPTSFLPLLVDYPIDGNSLARFRSIKLGRSQPSLPSKFNYFLAIRMSSPKARIRFPRVQVPLPRERIFPDDGSQVVVDKLDFKIIKLAQHLNKYSTEIGRQVSKIQRRDSRIQRRDSKIQRLESMIQRRDSRIQKRNFEIQRQGKQIQKLKVALRHQNTGASSAPKDKVRAPLSVSSYQRI